MVMVTHDIHMKAYAHRVVRMVDGKVSRLCLCVPCLGMCYEHGALLRKREEKMSFVGRCPLSRLLIEMLEKLQSND